GTGGVAHRLHPGVVALHQRLVLQVGEMEEPAHLLRIVVDAFDGILVDVPLDGHASPAHRDTRGLQRDTMVRKEDGTTKERHENESGTEALRQGRRETAPAYPITVHRQSLHALAQWKQLPGVVVQIRKEGTIFAGRREGAV